MDDMLFFTPDCRWDHAPRERTPQFFAIYSQVSIALQQALRERVLEHWLAGSCSPEDPQAAYPLLVYAASPIFRPKTRTEFNWDVLDTAGMQSFYRQTLRNLPGLLDRVHSWLCLTGRSDLAVHYRPHNALKILDLVRRQMGLRKQLQRPVVAEGRLLNELTRFSSLAQAPPRVRARADCRNNQALAVNPEPFLRRTGFQPAWATVNGRGDASIRKCEHAASGNTRRRGSLR